MNFWFGTEIVPATEFSPRINRVWNVGLMGSSLLLTVQDAHQGWIWTLLIDPAGRGILFSGSGKRTLSATAASFTEWLLMRTRVTPLMCAGDRTIRMWSLLGGRDAPPQLQHVLTGHTESVCSLAASRDGAYLYSGSDDKSVVVRVCV